MIGIAPPLFCLLPAILANATGTCPDGADAALQCIWWRAIP